MQCFRRNIKKCGEESWSRRQRYLNKDQIHYLLDDDQEGPNVRIEDGSVFANITEKISGTKYFLRIDLHQENVIRLRIDESHPFQGKKRYTPNVLLDIEKVKIENIRTEGDYYVLHINNEMKFRFNKSLKFELLERDEVVVSANSNGLFCLEYFREKPEGLEEEIKRRVEEQEQKELEEDMCLISNSSEQLSSSIDFDAWIEQFESEPEVLKNGPQSVGMDFTFNAENVYGIPIHACDLSLKSTMGPKAEYSEPYRLYNLDAFEFQLNEPMSLYGNVPMMIGHSENHTSGIFWYNCSETWVDVQKEADSNLQTVTHWFSETGLLDVFFLSGPRPKAIFRQFTSLVGTQDLPPSFSLSYHQCRWNYHDEEDIRQVNAKFEELNFPMDVLWLDIEHTDEKRYFTWHPKLFPNPRNMVDYISSFGRKIVTIIDPHIKRDPNWSLHQSAEENNVYILNDKKKVYEGTCWSGDSSWIDFTNPKAREWWASKFRYDQYQGSTPDLFVWNDMNEPSVFNGPECTMKKNAIHYQDWEHRNIHNSYGLWMQKSTYKGLIERNTNCDNNLRSFVLSRSFFAGSQRYGAVWTGDNEASWGHLAAVQPMLLSSGIAGISFIGADVGGFFGNPCPELLIRWYQVAAYQPFFRAHAHLDSHRREPWLFGEESLELMRDAVLVRYALLPYLYTLFHQVSISGIPIMRPLFVEYPTDQNTYKVQETFLLGSDLLVTPVSKEESSSANVYFPRGLWYDIYNHERTYGGVGLEVEAPLHKIPVYQRGGSIIPRKLRVRRTSSHMEADPITFFIALNDNNFAEGEIYIDDGKSFDYRSGKYAYRRIRYMQEGKDNFVIISQPEEYENRKMDYQKGGTYIPTNSIEKLVIIGQHLKPKNILLFREEESKGIPLDYEEEKGKVLTITIKFPDPHCFVGNPWRVTFKTEIK